MHMLFSIHAGLPIITSIFANYPEVFGSGLDFQVPAGFSSRILTCNVFGFPPPTVEWLAPSSSSGSNSRTTQNAIYFSAALEFAGGFQQSDSGMYNCSVRLKTNISQSQAITLEYTTDMHVTEPPPPSSCEVTSATASFEFRVLTTDCLSWSEETKQLISADTEDVLVGGILSQCQRCSINVAIERLNCSSFREGASVFQGVINNLEISLTQATFCALYFWWEFQPQIRVNGEFQPIDPSCMIQIHPSSSTGECSNTSHEGFSVLIIGSSTSLAVLVVISVLVIVPARRR